jgi:hypothetical protein
MSRLFRYWRIAFSALCGLAAVLFLALWMRSCKTTDAFTVPLGSGTLIFGSLPGECGAEIVEGTRLGWQWSSRDTDRARAEVPKTKPNLMSGVWGRFAYIYDRGPLVIVPDWFFIGVAAALSAAPWVRWSNQFSLRTLLITITLVAVVLGLIVWSING